MRTRPSPARRSEEEPGLISPSVVLPKMHRSRGAADRAFYQILTEELLGTVIANKDLGFVACGGVGQSKNMVQIAHRVGLRSAFIYDFDAVLFQSRNLLEIYQTRGGQRDGLRILDKFLHEQFRDERELKLGVGDAPKCGLDNAFVKANLALFQDALNNLSEVGIFLVPKGSLESWAPEVENKTRFAEEAPEMVLQNDTLKAELATFLIKVISFLA